MKKLLLPLLLGLCASACDDDELLYWEPDLTGHECSKTLKTCEPGAEFCFEGSCVPTCWDDSDCPRNYECAGISEDLETWKVCLRSPE